MTTVVSKWFIKQQAKKLKKRNKLTMARALDEISKIYGFSNYRHYLNVFENNVTKPKDVLIQYIEYFKLQANNLFIDYKTQTAFFDEAIEDFLYQYNPQHFNIEEIIMQYDINEENFSLNEAQDIIADMSGISKWTDLLTLSKSELELAKLLFDNKDQIQIEDWEMYINSFERDNNTTLDPESKIEIFNKIFLSDEQPL